MTQLLGQGTGGTLDSSEDDYSEEEDCGIHAYPGELATTVGTVETQTDALSATVESDGLVSVEEGMDVEGLSDL